MCLDINGFRVSYTHLDLDLFFYDKGNKKKLTWHSFDYTFRPNVRLLNLKKKKLESMK